MGVEERNLFLSVAAGGDKEVVAGMVKISSLIGNTSLHLDFLNMADNLSDDDLADFIQAAVDNPEDIADLVQQTKDLGGVDRRNFLAAAAESPNLTLLLSHVKELGNTELSDFLFSAARAGRAQGKLITLSNKLSEEEMEEDILSMASTLSQKDFENYLTASVNARSKRSGLHHLTQTLRGEKRELFLKAAANGGQETNALVRQVSKMGKSSAALGDFLNAASRTKDISGLISVVRETGNGRSKFLELAKDLHTADLENLIFAAKGMASTELGKLVDQGNSLSGIEKSHFFFGASKAGKKSHEFMNLIKGSRGQERKDLLLVMANIEEEEMPAMIGRAARMDPHEQRIQFLAQEKQELFGSQRQTLSSAYVHLSRNLSAGEFNDFLRAAGSASNEDDVDRLMEQMDLADDRATFLETAAGSGKELGNLLNLGERLIDEEKENFLGAAGKLKGESLRNFLEVAGSINSREELDEFVSFTDSLTGEAREYMLTASVEAARQDVLTKFMDLTNELTGSSRSFFLMVAEGAGGLGNFIEATQNFISSERNSFMAEVEKKGFHLMDLFEDDSETTYTLRDCCKEDISQFVAAARATGFDPDLIFSHDQSGYKFKNENSEYIQEYFEAIENEGFDLSNSYLMHVEPGMKLVGTTSGGVFKFLENAFASGDLLGSYVKPYLS